MTTTRLRDTRKSKIQSIAAIEIKIAREEARAEVRIATIKEQTAAKIATIDPDLVAKQLALEEFIDNNRQLFQKPRKHKTTFGSFGLQTASGLNWVDKAMALDFLVDQKMLNCFETTHKPVSAGIKNALDAGTKIPGVSYISGLIVKYVVDKALIKDAKVVE